MNAGDVVTVAVPTSAVYAAIAHVLVPWLKGRMSKRGGFSDVTPVDLPKRSNQSDQRFKAVLIESAERIESLHEALGKRSETGGWVVLEVLRSLKEAAVQQTQILSRQTDLLENCENHLRKLSGESPGRYRG